jgi:hypothetical protein
VSSWCPFKSENAPIEWLRVLLGLQPLTTTAYSLRVLRPLAGHFRQDSELIRAAVRVDTFATPAGAFRDPEPRKRCEHER